MLLINRYKNPKQNIRKMNSVMYEKRLYMIKESWSQESKDSFTLKNTLRTSLAVQWLRLWASIAGGTGSIPCQELWSTCHGAWTIEQLVPGHLGFPGGWVIKNPSATQETQFLSLGREDPLEKEMTTHSTILAWEIPWTEEPGGL